MVTIVQDGWTPYESEPKTDGSAATIHLARLFPLAGPGLGRRAQVDRHMPEGGLGGAAGTRTQDRRIMSPLL
jgi:hypothetical protein